MKIYSHIKSIVLILALFMGCFDNSTKAQTITYSNDFESYQGFGNIPATFGGGMKVYATHGTSTSKALCINFSQFVSKDSTITPASPILPAGSRFNFDYRYVTYAGGFVSFDYILTSDVLYVYVAPAGSSNFGNPLLTINANNHVNSINFSNQSVDLNSFAGQSVQIKLKGIRGASDDFWLDTDNFTIQSDVTSIATENSKSDCIIYPNPTSEKLSINIPTFKNPVHIEILNVLGATVLKTTLVESNSTIRIDALKKGIYYVKGNVDGKEFIKKLVIN
jgi:hypothetical protein